jgi:hypothetical protein
MEKRERERESYMARGRRGSRINMKSFGKQEKLFALRTYES